MAIPKFGSFRTVLGFGYALLALLVVVLACIAGVSLKTIRDEYGVVLERHVEDQLTAEKLREAAEHTVSSGRGYLLTGNEHHLEELGQAQREFATELEMLRARVTNTAAYLRLERIADEDRSYQSAMDDAIRMLRSGRKASEVVAFFEEHVMPRRLALDRELDAFALHNDDQLDAARAGADRTTRHHLVAVFVSTALALTTMIAVGILFTRRLGRLYDAEHTARSAAESAEGERGRALAGERTARLLAEEAKEAREEVLAIVSHDLRNPLSVIRLSTRTLAHKLTPAVAKDLRRIERAVDRMETLIRDLLDASAIEAGRMAVHPEEHDAKRIVADAVEMAAPLAAERSIALTYEIAGKPLRVRCDADRVLQVLANLIGNAIKFTPEGGTIVVRACRAGERIRFEVCDTGPGIRSENIPHLFDRYWSAKSSGRAGAGLGLYIAKGIVEAHGGSMSILTEPGTGTTFSFVLDPA